MKILVFIILTLVGIVFLPEQSIIRFAASHLSISGDGEAAMNNLDMMVLLIKALLSATGAFVLLKLCRLI
ncbi:hypothetical protein C9426_34705 [Serratia sp. S1B]|nr:hypothetical protein C9426_34705 [Serratia sp. S1B]